MVAHAQYFYKRSVYDVKQLSFLFMAFAYTHSLNAVVESFSRSNILTWCLHIRRHSYKVSKKTAIAAAAVAVALRVVAFDSCSSAIISHSEYVHWIRSSFGDSCALSLYSKPYNFFFTPLWIIHTDIFPFWRIF